MNLPLALAFSVKVWAVSIASAYNIELDPMSPRGRDLVPNYGVRGIFIVQWKEKLHHHRRPSLVSILQHKQSATWKYGV